MCTPWSRATCTVCVIASDVTPFLYTPSRMRSVALSMPIPTFRSPAFAIVAISSGAIRFARVVQPQYSPRPVSPSSRQNSVTHLRFVVNVSSVNQNPSIA